jgi:hypothetical protein
MPGPVRNSSPAWRQATRRALALRSSPMAPHQAPHQRPSSLPYSGEMFKRIQRLAKGARNPQRRKRIELIVANAISKLLASVRARAIASGKQLPRDWPRLKKQDFVPAICAEPTPNGSPLASRFAFLELQEHWDGKLLSCLRLQLMCAVCWLSCVVRCVLTVVYDAVCWLSCAMRSVLTVDCHM